MKKTSALIISALLATGCSFIPDYTRPDFEQAQKWNDINGYDTVAGEKAAQDLTWQEFFKSPALHNVISVALENNKDLRQSALNIEEARLIYNVKRADLLPTINGGASATLQKSSDEVSLTGQGQTSKLYNANIGVASYEFDLFGRIRSQNEASLNEYLATITAQNVVRNSLIAETANAYLQLLADKKLLSLTTKTLEAQEKSYDLLLKSRELGNATAQDVSRVVTAVETARVNLHQYKRFVEQDKNALTLLMGVASDHNDIPMDVTLDDVELMDRLAVGIPSEVLLARPDIRQAEYMLMARNADIGAARAAFFPNISLTGSYGFASRGLSDLMTSGAFGAWNFIPQVTLPIFEGGRNKNNLELANIRKEKAIVAYEQAIQVSFKEVADELAARATLNEQLKAQKRLVEAAQRVYDISDARYKSGIDSFLNVLDAQRELYVYQQNEIQIERQQLANLVNLYKVLGGGSQ